MAGNKIRVLLADDHLMVRAGIRALLGAVPGVEVVAEAADGREALELMPKCRATHAFFDITMPGMNGLEALARVRQSFPDVRVIMLSMHANPEYVHEALKQGAVGYLVKGAPPEELARAVKAVTRGEIYLCPTVAQVKQGWSRQAGHAPANPFDTLSPRQREVLQLIAEGRSTKEIARALSISVKTVETHRANLMRTLGIHDIPGLVRLSMRAGLISPQP
jgi:DNA-binding NarL/FixJ family response regulator